MKNLLISFQNNTDVIGLKYIHSYLCENQIDSYMLFIPHYNDGDNDPLAEFIIGLEPTVLGISLMSSEFHAAKKFTLMLKKAIPEVIVVWGGIHPTVAPQDCLNYADYVFVGESEQVYLDFLERISKNKSVIDIPNSGYKSPDGIVINKLAPLNENLDDLPFPEHYPKKSYILHNGKVIKMDIPLFERYSRYNAKFYSLVTTRGCPFSCSYCCNSAFNKLYGTNKIRKRSVENVIKELSLAIKLFPKTICINIQDDNFFTYDTVWMGEFAEKYKKLINKKFTCRTTPIHLNEKKISILKKAGLGWIFMGLQCGSPRINKDVYKRNISNNQFIESAKIVKKNNIAPFYDVILDNPYETEDDILQTIEVILKIPKPFMLQLFSLCFYQGTELYDLALKDNIEFDNPTKKGQVKYKPTFFNKTIRLCPLLPRKFIRAIIKHRDSKLIRLLISLIYFPAILILEPLVWFWLFFISFDYNLGYTINTIFYFGKTGFNKIILRR